MESIYQGFIYKITNIVNGKVYIGQTIRTVQGRFRDHLNKKYNRPLYNSIEKHGKNNFIVETIGYCPNQIILDQEERYWIKFYNSTNRDKGYNSDTGGHGGKKHSEESKRKMSKSQKGEKNHMFGKIVSEETREKQRLSSTGRKHLVESKKKMSERQIGKKNHNFGKSPTEETRLKMRQAHSGKNNHFYGKTHSDDTKEKIRLSRLGQISSEETRLKISASLMGNTRRKRKLKDE